VKPSILLSALLALMQFPGWIINFRSGYNPDTDKSWLKQQWGKPPFSTALEDAVEHRLQWEGASWCGGPKTEQGLWIYEDMQLRHMLTEQRRALRRVRLRRVLSNLPGLVSCGSAAVQ